MLNIPEKFLLVLVKSLQSINHVYIEYERLTKLCGTKSCININKISHLKISIIPLMKIITKLQVKIQVKIIPKLLLRKYIRINIYVLQNEGKN